MDYVLWALFCLGFIPGLLAPFWWFGFRELYPEILLFREVDGPWDVFATVLLWLSYLWWPFAAWYILSGEVQLPLKALGVM